MASVEGGQPAVKAPGGSSIMWGILYGIGYLTAASSIILLNKHILAVTPFHFPISLASLGVLFGWITSVVFVHTGFISLEQHKDITFKSWLMNVMPIGFLTGITLACGNMAYFYLSLSFLQIAKAVSPVCLFFILTGTGLDKFHLNVFLAVMVRVPRTPLAVSQSRRQAPSFIYFYRGFLSRDVLCFLSLSLFVCSSSPH